MLTPGVAVADDLELRPAERMERVGYTESSSIAAAAGS
jgi:hypothetical protein